MVNLANGTGHSSIAQAVAVGTDDELLSPAASFLAEPQIDFAHKEFTIRGGGGTDHQALEVMSTDIGADFAGLERAAHGHYPIGVLRIGPLMTPRTSCRWSPCRATAIWTGTWILAISRACPAARPARV